MELLSAKAAGPSSNTPVFVAWDGSERKNPGLAWGLSFVCPGAGQLYCGLWRSGLTTLIVFWCAVAVTVVTKTPAPTWGIALRYALALWCFATLDAYFSARDINSGAAPFLQGANPRVAAILNLTTKGWGYFYLGRKSAGIVTFSVLLVADVSLRRLQGHPKRWAYLIAEFVLIGLSAHAYYLGFSPARSIAVPQSDPKAENFSVGLPMVAATFVATVYLTLVTLEALLPDYKTIDQSNASITKKDDGIFYRNPRYGVALRFPPGWQVSNAEGNQFVKGVRPGGRCVLQFLAVPEMPYVSMSRHFDKLSKTLKAQGQIFDTERDTELGTLAAHEVTFRHKQDEAEIDQSYAEVRKGLSIYVVITSSDSETRSRCEGLSDQIKSSVRLP
ncbi:MAG TPA: hypothetical protein VG498_18950 [Terriglobales bacterium]|nr:hypothetical protein [Terriglobales bacterium]